MLALNGTGNHKKRENINGASYCYLLFAMKTFTQGSALENASNPVRSPTHTLTIECLINKLPNQNIYNSKANKNK